MATALPENESLQERMNSLQIRLDAANKERDRDKLVEVGENAQRKSRPKLGKEILYR